MNVVFIITDTQSIHHIGAYGNPHAVTPHLDGLCADGVRFERSYCNATVCTPARGVMFTGLHAPANGATFNRGTVQRDLPILGDWLRAHGVRAGYTGKWHLDGAGYAGSGRADGGFEADWWYDGANYYAAIGEERRRQLRRFPSLSFEEQLVAAWPDAECWGTHVADRAIDFLERVGADPFCLCVSFDEPHGPYMAPRRFLERMADLDEPLRPNFNASLVGKPAHQAWEAGHHATTAADVQRYLRYYRACNAFVDEQIGRVVAAVRRLHGPDTLIIYTSDHGEMMASHGQWSKGPVMYDEVVRVPIILQGADLPAGAVRRDLVSHVDCFTTICDALGIEAPVIQHGRSMLPSARHGDGQPGRDRVLIAYDRFGGGPGTVPQIEPRLPPRGSFHPIRCLVTPRHKLAINLLDRDEFYDLQEDPHELHNRIDDPGCSVARDDLHERLLAGLSLSSDPGFCPHYVRRPWNEGVLYPVPDRTG